MIKIVADSSTLYTRAEAEKIALDQPKIADMIAGKEIKKVIVVPNKLVNIVVG